MSYNGSGVFTINTGGQPVITGTTISSTVFNNLTADLATGLTTALTKDGQSTPTANIGMGAFKITNLAAGTVASDAARLDQVQGGAATFITVTGTDTLTGTVVPALSAYSTGNQFSFLVANTNTGAVTINVDGIGSKAITRTGTTALVAGDMVAGQAVEIIYDGTRFQLVNGNSFTNLKVSGTLAVTGIATFTAQPIVSSLTASLPVFTDASKGLVSNTMTGTGDVVMSTNAVLTTPALGTPSALVGTNITGTATSFNINGTVGATTPAAGTFTSLTDSGNLTFTGTGNRITGDFSNATLANRVAFQSSTTNGGTVLTAIPNGTSALSQIQLYSNSDPTNSSRLTVFNNGTTCSINADISGTGTYLPMTFLTGGSEKVRIDTSGNVGIGTASPGSKLDVNGNIVIGSVTCRAISGEGGQVSLNNTTDTATAYSLDVDGSNHGRLFTTQNNTNLSLGQLSGTGGLIALYTAGTERMRIDSTGNVGIGTSSPDPAVKLSVQQDQAAYSYFDYTNVTNGGGVVFRQIVRNLANTGTTSVDLAKLISSGFVINNNDTGAANYTGFGVGASERMRIDSSGNVGIGISSPSKKLEIYASAVSLQIESIVRNDMSGAGVAAIGFNVSSSLASETTSTKAGIGLVRSAAFGGGSLCFYNNNSGAAGDFTTADERMRIDSSGNVSLTGTLTVNGKWAGTGSSAGVLGGTIIGHECERNGTGSATNIMAFGNGSTSGKGLRMPFAGKLYAATLSGILVTGTVTVDFAINNVPNASYSLTGTGTASDISATGNYLASPLSFAAGDTIGWYQTTVPTVANGYFVSFYIMFD